MKIRIKLNGKYLLVDANHLECKEMECFRPGRYTHYSAAGASGCSHRTEEEYSCLTRDNHGCPNKAIKFFNHICKK